MQKYSIHASYTFHIWKWSILTTEVQSEEENFYWNIDKINHQDCSWPTRSSRSNYKSFDDAEIQMFVFILETFQIEEKEKTEILKYLCDKNPDNKLLFDADFYLMKTKSWTILKK